MHLSDCGTNGLPTAASVQKEDDIPSKPRARIGRKPTERLPESADQTAPACINSFCDLSGKLYYGLDYTSGHLMVSIGFKCPKLLPGEGAWLLFAFPKKQINPDNHCCRK